MALVKGTNCGFVTVAPSEDPAGGSSAVIIDTRARAVKDTTPVGAIKVTEIGWWADNATQEADFDVGIYSHDAGSNVPNALIGSSKNNAKGTDSGWIKKTGLDISITAETIYWIGVQLDNTATQTNIDYETKVGELAKYKSSQTSLPDSWGSSDGGAAALIAAYAVIELEINEYNQSVSGALTFIGTILKKTNKTPSGILTFTGIAKKLISRTIIGVLAFIGAVSKIRIYLKTITGILNFSGTETLRPNADGDTIELYNSDGNQTNNWSFVDEEVADDITTFVGIEALGTFTDLYNLPISSGSGTINKITVYARIFCVEKDNDTARIAIKSGTTTAYSGVLTTESTIWEDKSYEWSTNPDTGLAWTWDDINDLQIGVEATVTSWAVVCTQLYVVIDYRGSPGLLIKKTITTKAGVLTFTGIIRKTICRLLAGVLTFGAVIGKLTKITLSAALTFTGAVATFLIKIFPRHLKRVILLIRGKK